MANNKARGNAPQQNTAKEDQAKRETRSGSQKSQENMQAGSGGRGGHRKRKGGPPER
jgi:hypothetical protein